MLHCIVISFLSAPTTAGFIQLVEILEFASNSKEYIPPIDAKHMLEAVIRMLQFRMAQCLQHANHVSDRIEELGRKLQQTL